MTMYAKPWTVWDMDDEFLEHVDNPLFTFEAETAEGAAKAFLDQWGNECSFDEHDNFYVYALPRREAHEIATISDGSATQKAKETAVKFKAYRWFEFSVTETNEVED